MTRGLQGDHQPASPADRFRAAVEAGPLSFAERCAFRSLVAQEYARAEQRREEERAQVEMVFAA